MLQILRTYASVHCSIVSCQPKSKSLQNKFEIQTISLVYEIQLPKIQKIQDHSNTCTESQIVIKEICAVNIQLRHDWRFIKWPWLQRPEAQKTLGIFPSGLLQKSFITFPFLFFTFKYNILLTYRCQSTVDVLILSWFLRTTAQEGERMKLNFVEHLRMFGLENQALTGIKLFRDFPGDPMIETLCFQHRVSRFDSWSGN